MAGTLNRHTTTSRPIGERERRAVLAVSKIYPETLDHMRANDLVNLAAEIGDDPRAFYSRAASFLEQMVAEIANPRAKGTRAYKKAAEQFRRLAKP